jgi:hypothetical protein
MAISDEVLKLGKAGLLPNINRRNMKEEMHYIEIFSIYGVGFSCCAYKIGNDRTVYY